MFRCFSYTEEELQIATVFLLPVLKQVLFQLGFPRLFCLYFKTLTIYGFGTANLRADLPTQCLSLSKRGDAPPLSQQNWPAQDA